MYFDTEAALLNHCHSDHREESHYCKKRNFATLSVATLGFVIDKFIYNRANNIATIEWQDVIGVLCIISHKST